MSLKSVSSKLFPLYQQVLDLVKAQHEEAGAIAEEAEFDDLFTEELITDLLQKYEEVFEDVFSLTSENYDPSVIEVSKLEFYDFISAVKRLVYIYGLDRDFYYKNSKPEYDKYNNKLDYTSAIHEKSIQKHIEAFS